MTLIVQKYGGTSVGSVERIHNVARRALATQSQGAQVVVIVSAMAGETNRLLTLAGEITPAPDRRELDVIAATGEQVSSALTALAIQAQGGQARSFLGHKIKMKTDNAYSKARILGIDAKGLRKQLDEGGIAVVAGYQGVDEQGNITTLGRGGSDTSAVAIAAAIGADCCEIYTDVDGVYTADPRVVPNARKLHSVSYEEMLEMASLGARVLQIRSVKFATRYGVPIHVRSSFKPDEGTWVMREEDVMERLVVSGVTHNLNEAKIRVKGVKDHPGIAGKLFAPLSDAGVMIDM
ncbi:MAG: aspartate kinase, partial [Polyangiaceae bacterium]